MLEAAYGGNSLLALADTHRVDVSWRAG